MAMVASMKNINRNFTRQKFQRFWNNQKYHERNYKPTGMDSLIFSTITCRYYNKIGHIEQDCRNKHYDIKGKWILNDFEANNTRIQSQTSDENDENEDDNFIQIFMSEMNTKRINLFLLVN